MIGISALRRRVLEQYARPAQALGLGGPHVVLLEHLQHRRAHVPAPAGDLLDGQARHRQDEVPGDVTDVALLAQRLAAEQREVERPGADLDR